MEKQTNNSWTAASITWLGAFLVARELLLWSKANVEDDDKDSALAKLNKPNFIARVQIIIAALMTCGGATLEAAQFVQQGGKGFFTEVTAESLQEKMAEALASVQKAKVWKFRTGELGSFDFQPQTCGGQDCDCKPEDDDQNSF